MNNKNYIDQRLQELGIYSNYYYRLELKALAQLINVDETLNSIITGVVNGRRRMVAVTNYRIIIIASGVANAGEVSIISRKAVKSWSFTKKFLLSSAVINTENETFEIKQTQASQEKLFSWAMNQPIKEFDD